MMPSWHYWSHLSEYVKHLVENCQGEMSDMYGYSIKYSRFSGETWQVHQEYDGNGCHLHLAASISQLVGGQGWREAEFESVNGYPIYLACLSEFSA